ncbi:MAG: DNA-directed RNA polymerase subunit omega [Verrucomicrobia bacterium]|nr:DNA-directed RNA polymerase subunit omega [Verrucomicrobiota bacterium]
MQAHLLDEASKQVSDPLVLVNAVSKRVRQLVKGQRPMVETGARVDWADVALREIIEGKLAVRDLIASDDF